MPTLGLYSNLASARYSTQAATFLAAWSGVARPGLVTDPVHFDGDFSEAKRTGHAVPEFPFAESGDTQSKIVRQRYWQLAKNFRATAMGTPAEGDKDLLLVGEVNFRDEGAGIISWDREYANVPQSRDEFDSFAHGFQYMDQGKISEKIFTVPSRVRCDYFHVKDLASQRVFQATRAEQLTDNIYFLRGKEDLHFAGRFFVSSDPEIVAEDSIFKMWRYPIMERRTRWVAAPTLEFWGEQIFPS